MTLRIIGVYLVVVSSSLAETAPRCDDKEGGAVLLALSSKRRLPLKAVSETPPKIQNEEETMRKWWENASIDKFAHRDYSNLGGEENLVQYWKNAWLTGFNLTNADVVDYGIGAGLLGKVLFSQYGIHSYVGIDISQESLDASWKMLQQWKNRVKLVLTPQKFSDFQPSFLVSQAVIQHFPSVEYFNEFLQNVDNSGAQRLMLQVRFGNQTFAGNITEHERNGAMTLTDVAFALKTNADYMQTHLSKYKLVWEKQVPAWQDTYYQFTSWNLM